MKGLARLGRLFVLFFLVAACSNVQTPSSPAPSSTPLATTLLTIDDILAPEVQTWDFVPGVTDSFLKEETAKVTDHSSDLQDNCQIECTKQLWETSYRHLEINMFRTDSELSASDTAGKLFRSLAPYDDEYGIDEYKWVNAPTPNSHIGFSIQKKAYVLTTATGRIALMIVSYPSPYSDDRLHEVSLMAAFANLQIDKLVKANIVR
jgi:hypothetical protein